MKTLFRLFTFCILVALVIAGYLGWQAHKLLIPAAPAGAKLVAFEVVTGTSGSEIAHQLKMAGVIDDELSFRLLLRFHSKGTLLRAGVFRLDPAETPLQVFDRLLTAEPLTSHATFPEGLVIPQVAAILVKSGVLSQTNDFVHQAQTNGQAYGDWLPSNLEGYLFPDTYTFPFKNTDKSVLQRMTGEFAKVILPIWDKKKAKSPLKSFHDVVVLASLVEREAQVDSERGRIAGVYVNRIKKGMKLECDATVQYALGKQKALLSLDDLKIDSPYNTYQHVGLPPGPIANPGKKSLEAAMSPTPSEYLYYVRNDIKDDGSHVFGRTYAEHLDNCRKFQK